MQIERQYIAGLSSEITIEVEIGIRRSKTVKLRRRFRIGSGAPSKWYWRKWICVNDAKEAHSKLLWKLVQRNRI